MPSLDQDALVVALERFSETASVLAPDRVCIATSGGRLPHLSGRTDLVVHWTGSGLPWFLRPLALIFSASRCLVELNSPAGIVAFAREADDCNLIKFYSFPRALLPAMVAYFRAGASEGGAPNIVDQDATYAELTLYGDVVGEDGWVVDIRHNRDCPSDLVKCLNTIYDLE